MGISLEVGHDGLFDDTVSCPHHCVCGKIPLFLQNNRLQNYIADNQKESDMSASTSERKIRRNRITTYGVIAIVLGILAMLAPGLTGLSVAFLLGVIVLAAGIVRIVWAFQAGTFGKGLAGFAIGVLTLICGVLLVANPLFASGVLTILLALYFICDGVFEIVVAVQCKPLEGWGWLLFGGIVSLLLGLMIWGQYPLAGAWAMGILIGIKLFMVGLIMVTGGSVVRDMEKERDEERV